MSGTKLVEPSFLLPSFLRGEAAPTVTVPLRLLAWARSGDKGMLVCNWLSSCWSKGGQSASGIPCKSCKKDGNMVAIVSRNMANIGLIARTTISASTLCKRLCFVYYFAKSKTVGFRKPEYLPILRHQAPESVPIASTWGILGHTARSRPREWNPISQNELKEIVNDLTSQAGFWVRNCCDFMPVKCRCFRNWWNELCDAGKGIRNSTFLCRDEMFQARLLLAAAGCALYTVRLASTCGVNVIVCWFWESTRHELAKHCPFSWFLPGLFTISMWLVGKSLLGDACCMRPCLGPFGKDLRSNFVIDEAWLNTLLIYIFTWRLSFGWTKSQVSFLGYSL